MTQQPTVCRRLGFALSRHRFRRRFVLALALAASLVAGCGVDSGSPTSDGASISIVLPQEPRSLAPWAGSITDGMPVVYNIQEALVTRDPATYELAPQLATSWEQTAPTVWRFALREGVQFTDGTPFNGDAAAQVINYVWSADNNFANLQFMGPQITATAVDEHTVDVETAEPDPILPSRMYFSPMVAPSLLGTPEFETMPIGTGPYRLASWDRGREIRLETNDQWWGLTELDESQRPTIDNVTFTFNTDSAAASAAVQAGTAQLAVTVQPQHCVPKCISSTTPNAVFLRLDASDNPALEDIRVRQAIALAINKDEFVKELMPDGQVASQLVGPGAVGYDDALKPYPYDPDQARRLLSEAEADGVAVDSLKLIGRLDTPAGSSRMVQVVSGYLNDVGLPVTTQMMERSQLNSGLRSHPAPNPPDRGWILLYIHGNPLFDLSATASSYYTCTSVTGAYCNPDLDAMDKAALSLTGPARQDAYAKIAQFVYDNFVVVPIGYPANYYAAAENLQWTARRDELVLVNTMRLE